MSICIHACMYVCMYVCIHLYIYIYIYIYRFVCVGIRIHNVCIHFHEPEKKDESCKIMTTRSK